MIRLILLTDFTEAFAHNLLEGILKYSKGREPWVVCRMPPSYKQAYGIDGVLEWAIRWKADAIIGQFDSNDPVECFQEHGIVAVAQDYKSRFITIPNITGLYEQTGQMAADFFLQKGFKNFAFYGYKDVVWSNERCQGFCERIKEKGYGERFWEYQKQPLDSLWYYESEPLAEWLHSLPHPTALMACDDTSGNRILEVCRTASIRVPEDIAVLGVDNDELMCSMSDPPLSSVGTDTKRGGYDVAGMIERFIRKKDCLWEDVVIRPTLIINRLSTDIYCTLDPYVLSTLRYIHQNLSNKLSVESLVKRVPLSRRLLEIRFKEVTNQPLYRYIFGLRMERFSQALLASDAAISELAAQVGIFDLKNLARQFRQWKGCSPAEFRRHHKME